MSDTVIRVENLGKKYTIGHQGKGYGSFREMLSSRVRRLWAPADPTHSDFREEFWALQDVNFEVKRGDRLGIIGRNGAGKSTLLKILSRITEPTTGRVTLRGRVASLLEVGTGFHPELTGRENIFLNGVILGMKREEIQRKFDEIVAFAEVERFLDTPVKHYSSGMYVRLAFAVAAHLDPEILVVDEVLAVGDAAFQKKCLGKMEDVAEKEGRTVLFVSHNMSTIENLCLHGIYLKQGKIQAVGKIASVVSSYLQDTQTMIQKVSLTERRDRSGSGRVRIVGFEIVEVKTGLPQNVLKSGEDYILRMRYNKHDERILEDVVASIGIQDERGQMVMLVRSNFTRENVRLEHPTGCIDCEIKNLNLALGHYRCILFLSYRDIEVLDHIPDAAELVVDGGDFFGTGSPGLSTHCKILTLARWRNS